MPTTDINKIINDLLEFYDLADQTIVSIGAGGGQLVGYGRDAKMVIAVDNDAAALEKLQQSLDQSGLAGKFTLVHSDFYLFSGVHGDVVLFEFCLHEMSDPAAAIKHALSLAPRVLVMDHWIHSDWAYVIDEKEKIERSWSTLESFHPAKFRQYDSLQVFHDYGELYQKIKDQGQTAITRIEQFRDATNFSIPFSYAFAMITEAE